MNFLMIEKFDNPNRGRLAKKLGFIALFLVVAVISSVTGLLFYATNTPQASSSIPPTTDFEVSPAGAMGVANPVSR